MGKRNRPSLGRSRAVRGLDQFDTPPIALDPLFQHEPLLANVIAVAEPFCGKGNLVTAMRARGLIVHASDIQDRGCPDSTVLDFLAMTSRPPDCDVLLSNPPYGEAMDYLEHAWVLGFRLVAFLLPPSAWFVFDRDYCGPATINPVSIHRPATRMPWLRTSFCEQCRKAYEPKRSSSRFCSPACRQRAHHKKLSVTLSVTRTPTPSTVIEPSDSKVFRYVRHADVPRFTAEGWELLPALDGTHHGEYSVLMRRIE
jgi:hypothetical protein